MALLLPFPTNGDFGMSRCNGQLVEFYDVLAALEKRPGGQMVVNKIYYDYAQTKLRFC